MQAVDREAAQLVWQFLAVSPQQQAPAAKALVQNGGMLVAGLELWLRLCRLPPLPSPPLPAPCRPTLER
jgi:hypothetical protein